MNQYWRILSDWPGHGTVFGLKWNAGSYSNYLTGTLPIRVLSLAKLALSWAGFFTWALTITQCNYFSSAISNAKITGQALADLIENGKFGKGSVSLVGFSLGTRVIFECLQELAQRNSEKVHDVILLGGAAPVGQTQQWRYCRRVVAGRMINVYSKRDHILSALYVASQWEKAIGSTKLKVEGVENFNATDIIDGHMAYHEHMFEIFKRIRHNL